MGEIESETGHGRDGDVDLARRASAGDSDAFGQLFERWFDRAFDVAWHVVRNRDAAADVTQEAFAAAWQQIAQLRQPESFGGWLLRITRNKALNRLRREQRSRPVGDEPTLVDLQAAEGQAAADAGEPLLEQERDALVWAAAAALGDEDASLLSLHLRHGLEPAELADELGVQPNAAHQRLFRLRKRLGEAIGAWVLWRRGTPSCPELATAVGQLDRDGFDRSTAQTIWRHARTCDTCESTRQLRLDPSTLFAAIPIVVAPPLLRAKAAAALQSQGVPTGATDTAPDPSSQAGASGGDSSPPPTDDAGTGELDDAPESPAASRRGRALRRAAAAMAAVVVLVAGLLVAFANQTDPGTAEPTSDEDQADNSSTGQPRRTDPGSTTTTASAAPSTAGIPPPTTAGSGPPTESTGSTTAPPAPDTTLPTAPPPAPPTIGGFRATQGQQSCPTGTVAVVFVWSTTDADEITLGPSDGASTPVGASGTTERCATPESQWTLTATNPGGTTTANATAPAAPPPIL